MTAYTNMIKLKRVGVLVRFLMMCYKAMTQGNLGEERVSSFSSRVTLQSLGKVRAGIAAEQEPGSRNWGRGMEGCWLVPHGLFCFLIQPKQDRLPRVAGLSCVNHQSRKGPTGLPQAKRMEAFSQQRFLLLRQPRLLSD